MSIYRHRFLPSAHEPSPRRTFSETSSSARTPGKLFEMFFISTVYRSFLSPFHRRAILRDILNTRFLFWLLHCQHDNFRCCSLCFYPRSRLTRDGESAAAIPSASCFIVPVISRRRYIDVPHRSRQLRKKRVSSFRFPCCIRLR